MKKKLFTTMLIVSVIALAFAGCKTFGEAPPSPSIAENAKVEVITNGATRYHVFVYQADAGAYTSTMVETLDQLIIVDLGMSLAPKMGSELRAYADAINKPMSVIITHPHADHYSHINAFSDIPVYAQSAVAKILSETKSFTDLYSKPIRGVESEGMIGGLKFDFSRASFTESPENSYITLPEQKVLFAKDLVYSGIHPYIREYTPNDDVNEIDNWLNTLEELKAYKNYKYVFMGHNGYSKNVLGSINATISYLTDAQALIKGSKALSSGKNATTIKEVVDELGVLYDDWISGALVFPLPGAFFESDPGAAWFK